MKDLRLWTIDVTQTLHDAMEKITLNKSRAVVVTDDGKVVGTVSDGDIRRALLKDTLTMAPVEMIMNINCRKVLESERHLARAAMMRENLTVLPIVNEDNELVDVELQYDPEVGAELGDSLFDKK